MTDQPSLFDGLERISTGERQKSRYVRPVDFGACPECTNTHVGLVPAPSGRHLMWKVHRRPIGGATFPTCPASGQLLCDIPARSVPMLAEHTPSCPCMTP